MVGNKPRGLLLAGADVAPKVEEEFNQWYDSCCFRQRMTVPGFLDGHRFRALQGAPQYLAVYDLESVDVLESEAYRHQLESEANEQARRILPYVQTYGERVFEQTYPPTDETPPFPENTGNLLMTWIEISASLEKEFNDWYAEHVPAMLGVPGVLRGRRFVAVRGLPKYLALYEVTGTDRLQGEAYESVRYDPLTLYVLSRTEIFVRNVYELV